MRNLATLPLLGLLLLITACSQAEDGIDSSLNAVFPNAAAEAEDAGTFRFEMRMEMDDPTFDDLLGDSISMTAEGAYDLDRDASRVSMNVVFTTFETITIDGRSYMGMHNILSDELFWMESDTFALDGSTLFEDDPLSDILDGGLFDEASAEDTIMALKLVSTDVEDLGEDDIDGVIGHHYRAHISGDDPNAAELEMAANDRMTIDLWLDEIGRPVRQVQEMTTTGDLAEGTTSFKVEMDYFDYGQPVDIEAPAAGEILDEDEFFEAVFGFDDSLFDEDFDFDFDLGPTLEEIDPPCFGTDDEVDACRFASDELKAAYSDPTACDGDNRRLCILPVGNVPAHQLQGLQGYFLEQYGLEVAVLPPVDATDDLGTLAGPGHWQVGYYDWANQVLADYQPQFASGARIISVTPVDVYQDYPGGFTFGSKQLDYRTGEGLFGIVSTFRFNPVTQGEEPDDTLWFERTRKMVTKYAGILHWGLEEEYDDDTAAMYRYMFSLEDMDAITGHLPIAPGTPAVEYPRPTTPPIAAGAPCTGADFDRCLEPDPTVAARWADESACDAGGHRICIVPIGAVPEWQVEQTLAQLKDYGIDTRVLPPIAVPDEALVPYPTTSSMVHAGVLAYMDLDTQYEISFLYLTPVGVADSPVSEAGLYGTFDDTVSLVYRYAIVPTFRLDPKTYGEPADDTLLGTRIETLVARAAGDTFYYYPESESPTSPMFNGLYSLEALDAMTPNLPGTH